MAKNKKTIDQFTTDPENRRKRTERGSRLLVESLTKVGAARSIVIDEADTILAGNGVMEAAAAAGITKVQVVEADGQTIIAVRRRGLTPEQKRELALYDNRTAELAEWNPQQIAADQKAGLELQPFFTPGELRALLKATPDKTVVSEVAASTVQDRFWISIEGPLPQQARALKQLQALMADVEGVTVELGTVPDEAGRGW